jgi:hypothetical protein
LHPAAGEIHAKRHTGHIEDLMKRRHIQQLWIELFLDHLLSGVLSLGAVAFFCLLSLKWEVWPLIIAGVVLALFTASLMKEVIWCIRATRAFLSSVPVPFEVTFLIDWELPPGYVGCPQGPTPCYAILKSNGSEHQVRIHPLIFKSRILNLHDGRALVYGLAEQPYAIETRVGLAWVIR